MLIRRKTYKDLLRRLEGQANDIEHLVAERKRDDMYEELIEEIKELRDNPTRKSLSVCKGGYTLYFVFDEIDNYFLSTLEELIHTLRESAENCLAGTKEDFMLHGMPATFDPYTKQEINKLKISTLSALGEFITRAANDLSYRSGNVSKSDFERLSRNTRRALEEFLKGVGEDLP